MAQQTDGMHRELLPSRGRHEVGINDAHSLRHVILAKDERAWATHPRRSSMKTVKCYSFVQICTAKKLFEMLGARS